MPQSPVLLARLTTLSLLAVLPLTALPAQGAQVPRVHGSPSGMLMASEHSKIVISNDPRTAVVGRTERFWALLSGQPHTRLIYVLRYPDGHAERIPVRTDGHGYSSHTFRVRPYTTRRFREVATLSIEDASGRVLAFTRFAIESPDLHAQAHGHSTSRARGHQHPASTDARQHGAGHAQASRTSTANADPAITAVGLTRNAGAGHSSAAVSGSGFTPHGPITLTFDGSSVDTSCTADATGSFSYCGFTIPAVAAGTHTVTATDSSTNFASARFTV
jgi:hypothetical protein